MKTIIKNHLSISLLLLLTGFTSAVNGQGKYTAPGTKFDLTPFTLQLPLEQNSSITQKKGEELAKYSSNYFYLDPKDQSIHLFCTSDGTTTKGSHFPRTELREINEWHFTGQHEMSVKLAVLQQPNSGKIIIGQIHGHTKGTEAAKLWWNNGDLQIGFKKEVNDKEQRFTLLKNIPLNQVFSYTISQSDYTVTVTVNDQSQTFTFGDSWTSEPVYFKVGNYLQDNSKPVTSGLVAVHSVIIK